MEAAHSSRSSSTERDDAKMRDVDVADISTSSAMQSSADGENSPTCSEEKNSELQLREESTMGAALKRKIHEGGLGDVRVPQMAPQMSGCSDSEETDSDDDDDLCSSSDEESSFNPMASGVMPPVLPDIQIRVPMEDEDDARRVKEALLVKGVLDVVCDQGRQIVTVTGVVPPSRLLKKVRKVNRQARIVSTVSPLAVFINPHFRSSGLSSQEESDNSPAIDIPVPHAVPNFVVYQQRPRPAFQRYTFHNDPHSPYLRTFSPTDLSPINSPPLTTSDACDHHRRICSSFLDDESFFFENGVMST